MGSLIAAFLYKYIYLLLVTILTLVVYSMYIQKGGLRKYRYVQNEYSNWILVIFLIIFIGLRPVNGLYFADMYNYAQEYDVFKAGMPLHFDKDAENIIFDNLFSLWGSLRLGYTSFFVFISAIYFGVGYVGIRRLFPEHVLPVYLIFLGAFSTFSYGTNGIKAGAAASVFIWAISYYKNWKVCILLAFVSMGFHHSMKLPVAALILTYIFKKPKWYFCGWVFCMLMAVAHVSSFMGFFASFEDEHSASYLTGKDDTAYITGFRPDFIAYSAMPVLVGYYAVFKKRLELSDTYKSLLNLYLFTNGVWMLCMYASYTNRIAYLSWFLYPIVLIYPYLNENWGPNKYQIFAKVMLAHLGFTLFMELIYYSH